jgi:hypothetical protein
MRIDVFISNSSFNWPPIGRQLIERAIFVLDLFMVSLNSCVAGGSEINATNQFFPDVFSQKHKRNLL